MAIQIIGDRRDWNKINSNLVDRLNKEAETEKEEKPKKKKAKSLETPQTENFTPLIVETNIDPSEYVRIGINGLKGNPVLISKFEIPSANNKNYNETHEFVLSKGLYIPTPAIFMTYFKNVMDAHDRKAKLFDGNGQEIKAKELKDIYQHLTKDHIDVYSGGNVGAWTWLNARFVKGTGFKSLDLETIIGIDKKGNFQTEEEPLLPCHNQDSYVDLQFNNQGLATNQSGDQNYKPGENIYFWTPRKDCVAGFGADAVRAGLSCWDPDYSDASLGVFACAEGAVTKKSGGKK